MAEIKERKVTLTRTGNVLFGGKHVGIWNGGKISGGGYHFRPSPFAGESIYTADLDNGQYLRESGRKLLVEAIEKIMKSAEA